MTKMQVKYEGKLRTVAKHLDSNQTLFTDAPKDNQGEGQSFSPTDLLATSLGSCMLTIMGIRAKALGLALEGCQIDVEKIMQSAPRKVSELKLKVTLPANLSAENRRVMEEAALTCPVYLSLDPAMMKSVEFHYAAV